MNIVEIVKSICKERKIPISRLEKECGFSNGYINSLKNGVFPTDRLLKIADYFGVSIDYMLGNNSSENIACSIKEDFKDLIIAYKNNPDMQPAVNKLLGLEYKKEM